MNRLIVAVAGGTGSGKSTLVEALASGIGRELVAVIHHDAYYRDRSALSPERRAALNYDHPDALESALLVAHLERLRAGEGIDAPIYDFTTHTRRAQTRRIEPRPVLLLDGILVLADAALRSRVDLRVFVDTDDDVRFIRRLRRDLDERARSLDSVVEQYVGSVKPMHDQFVEPSKRFAHLIVPEGGENREAVETLLARIRARLDGG